MSIKPRKKNLRTLLRRYFDSVTVTLEQDHRDGLRILAKQCVKHRVLMAAILSLNLFAALFEGGTIGILAIAVSVLVEGGTGAVNTQFGMAGPVVHELLTNIGRGGVFLVLVLSAVLAQVFKSGLTYMGKYYSIRLRYRVTKELQDKITRQAMRLSYAEIAGYPAGIINATINQGAGVASLIMTFNKLTLTVLMLTVYVGVMIAMSIPLTLSAIAVIIVLGVSLNGIIRKLKELGEKLISATLATGKITIQYLQAPRLLRIFNATGYAERVIASTRAEAIEAKEKSEFLKAGVGPATDAITIAGAGAFLVIGYFVAGENATSIIPSLLLFVFVLNRMMPQVKSFNESRMNFVNMLPTVKRIASFLRTEDKTFSVRGGRPFSGLEKEIRFENVGFCYPDSERVAVSDIDLTLVKGHTLALVGASGAGKSTIADLMLGLYEPTEGKISVDGVDLSSINMRDWRSTIGVVDQEVLLLNASIVENITFGDENASLEAAVEAAKAAYAHEFIKSLPEQYDTVIGDRGYRLSGGQQQRLALARALLRNPEVLVLDEATSALDTESEQVIQQTLEALHKERTMLLIAHRLSTLAIADYIVVLQHGRIVERGTWEELMKHEGMFARLWSMQSVGDSVI